MTTFTAPIAPTGADPAPDVGDLDDEPLRLPAAWVPPPRPPLPLLAGIVPVVGAVVLWLVTGSMLALWLAALAPLVIVATAIEARRAARRDRRIAIASARREHTTIAAAIQQRHGRERARLRRRFPDVRALLAEPERIWRAAAGADVLVVGGGEVASAVRVGGGEGDPAAAVVRARASRLAGAPIVVPASGGIAVTGPPVLAAAVHRALVLQLCLAHPPGELRLAVQHPGAEWIDDLPHLRAPAGAVVAVLGPGTPVPREADIVLALRHPGEPPPPECAAVLDVTTPATATLLRSGEALRIEVEAVSTEQARAITTELSRRAEHVLGWTPRGATLRLGPLLPAGPRPGEPGLRAVIGAADGAPVEVDLVADGPHAVVTGVTGSGKSELLLTWVISICATRTPDEVNFLLADFKGGTAFDPLAGLPHVVGVITDLDGTGARRAIESLRAEIRHREGVFAGTGARDVSDSRVRVPRLVVVVDEYAALVTDHPELAAVFADVAARGRALGLHLILGTQRAAGVVREGLLANCPLRVSLRVADSDDSRLVLGTDDAAMLPGGIAGRGQAFVRRAGDSHPQRATVALSDDADIAAVRPVPHVATHRPWLAPLPHRLHTSELVGRADAPRDRLLLGLADEPELQRQRPVGIGADDRGLLVVGGPRSGRSTALATLASQAHHPVLVPGDPEGAWDCVTSLLSSPPGPGALVVVDDLDALAGRFSGDHGQVFLERLEWAIRAAGASGAVIAVSVQRVTGGIARLIDLLPRRLVLALPTRGDHLAAGGEADHFTAGAPAGRGRLDGITIQVAMTDRDPASDAPAASRQPAAWADPDAVWSPTADLTGVIARRSPLLRDALRAWEAGGASIRSIDDHTADPRPPAGPLVIVGEPDDWQRNWRLLADVRGDHLLVVDAACAPELRLLAGVRDAPPYCEPGRRRAWLIERGGDPARIVLPGETVRRARVGDPVEQRPVQA